MFKHIEKLVLCSSFVAQISDPPKANLQQYRSAFIAHKALRQGSSVLESNLYRTCDLVLRLSKVHNFLFSLRPSGSCLRLLLHPVSSIFPSITCFRRQFYTQSVPDRVILRFFFLVIMSVFFDLLLYIPARMESR